MALKLCLFLLAVTVLRIAEMNLIKIAHLQPNNPAIQHEPHVLRMCARDLKERSILPKEIDLKVMTMESCNRYSGVENAAFLHYVKNASVYFGPGCNNEMLVIGRLVSRWNVPIIAHLSGDDALSDRTVFDTLGSVALTSATEMARATLTFLSHYGWKRIGLVRSTVNYDRLSVHSLKNYLKEYEVEVNVEIELDPYMGHDEIIASGKLKTLQNNARIIVVEMGLDVHSARSFMVAVARSGMKTHEYVYVVPWLAHLFDHYPWEASNVDKLEARNAFDGTIVITAHGYDKKFIEEFEERFSKLTGIISNHYATLSYMSLYDALFLYGLAIRDAFEETRNHSVYTNGKLVWQKMTSRQFIGSTGQVLINNKAVRVPSYATYHVRNGTMRIAVELTARLEEKHLCRSAEGDCSEHTAHEVIPNWWGTHDGELPRDMPNCGYDGGLCDYTAVYVAIGVLAFLGVCVPIGYLIWNREKERMLYDMNWRVPREQVRLLEMSRGTAVQKSQVSVGTKSVGSGSFTGSFAMSRLSTRQAIANGVRCSYKRYHQTRNLTFPKNDLARLKELKLLENDNLNKFYGMCFNQQNELIVLWLLCQRGSLEDVLFNEEMKITRNFQISFTKDVVKGLYFLHNSPLRMHGFLCLQNCLVDSNWNIRLTNFVTDEIVADKLRHNELRLMLADHHRVPSRTGIGKGGGGKVHSNAVAPTPALIGAPGALVQDSVEVENGGKKRKTRKKEREGQSDSSESAQDEAVKIEKELANEHEKAQMKKYVQQAPEIIREYITNRQLPPGSPPADIYALGMVIYQILFKLEPFYERQSSRTKILEKIALANEDDVIIRPSFPNQQNLSNEEAYNLQLLSAIEACWLEIPEMRPNIKRIKAIINANLKSTGSGSLVDQMVQMMEEYTTNLEQLVRDRTAMLEDAQQQADRLLKSMLPPQIAEDLKVGKPVVPQLYSNATVLFSDIRGFTRISSMSTPLQIVNFLNDLFSGFDAIIAKHDAYKVETIGDAYMIVSGVPKENGNSHVQHIADIALKMRTFVSNFKLAHRPEEIMMVRIGFHSGTVAAGVVGLAAPRYCLFGDTVNMASRMESTGQANKIQITESSYNLIKCFYPQYMVVERGKVEVKGKGECLTFFLEGREIGGKKK